MTHRGFFAKIFSSNTNNEPPKSVPLGLNGQSAQSVNAPQSAQSPQVAQSGHPSEAPQRFGTESPVGGQSAFSTASSGFKLLNPELFIKPVKAVYIPGTILFVLSIGIVGYTIFQEKMDQNTKKFMKKQKPQKSHQSERI